MIIELPGIKITVVKSSEVTDGNIAVFKENTAPGMGPPLHRHHKQTEVFHIRKGKYRFQIEDDTYDLSEGDCAVVLPGKVHAFKNIGEDEGELIFELYPALDSDEFFLELSKVKDEKQIASMFKNYSGELIGPSPL